jgi:hypothetical protein
MPFIGHRIDTIFSVWFARVPGETLPEQVCGLHIFLKIYLTPIAGTLHFSHGDYFPEKFSAIVFTFVCSPALINNPPVMVFGDLPKQSFFADASMSSLRRMPVIIFFKSPVKYALCSCSGSIGPGSLASDRTYD